MKAVFEDKKKRILRGQEEIKFNSRSSRHLISITARVKSKKQISASATDDEDLTIELDGKKFPTLTDPRRVIDSPASFSGGALHNLSKTVCFVAYLDGDRHRITFKTDEPTATATFERLEVYVLDNNDKLELSISKEAEDGDRRSWITFVIDSLPLSSFSFTALVRKRYRDSDDIKVVVDGKIWTRSVGAEPFGGSSPLEWFYRFWYFTGSILLGIQRLSHFKTKLPRGLHYIELFADRKPYLESVEFDFSNRALNLQSYKDDRFNKYDEEIARAVDYWNDFFLSRRFPPIEPLDPNLVKALIYVESRLGYGVSSTGHTSFPDIMQVGNPSDPALHVLNNDKSRPMESEAYSGKVMAVDYKGEAKVNTSYESIYWGVRWLYHKAQNIDINEKQIWYSWREAISRYGPGREMYTEAIWNLYKYGRSPDGGENLF